MPRPKWLNKKLDSRTKAGRQEKQIAKELGGKVTKNSGAGWSQKGDIIIDSENELAEVKSTEKEQMVLKKEWLKKIHSEATKEGKEPIFIADFGEYKLLGIVRRFRRKGGK